MSSLAGCETSSARLAAAGASKADASIVGQAIAAQADLPDYPAACRARVTAVLQRADSPEDMITKYDHALSRANTKFVSCGAWYDDIKYSRAHATDKAGAK